MGTLPLKAIEEQRSRLPSWSVWLPSLLLRLMLMPSMGLTMETTGETTGTTGETTGTTGTTTGTTGITGKQLEQLEQQLEQHVWLQRAQTDELQQLPAGIPVQSYGKRSADAEADADVWYNHYTDSGCTWPDCPNNMNYMSNWNRNNMYNRNNMNNWNNMNYMNNWNNMNNWNRPYFF